MDIQQAIECAEAFSLPGLLVDAETIHQERMRTEDALKTLLDAWQHAPAGSEPCDFSLIQSLADKNRSYCDTYGIERLANQPSCALARKLATEDLILGLSKIQHRSVAKVARHAGVDGRDLAVSYVEAPVSGMVVGIDIETTDKDPARGYIINVGLAFMELAYPAVIQNPYSAYCGLPDMYRQKGVPLARIHHISWEDVQDKTAFRDDNTMQKALLKTLSTYPYLAHNASFEDSWFTLHIDGYAAAKKAGKIALVDTRNVCRQLDPEVRTLPRESSPAALENWARRRHTLAFDENERHLGLEDVELMLRTTLEEFRERNMLSA